MTKAPRLNLTPQQIRLAHSLRSGYCDFDDLTESEKLRVAAIPYDMDGIVDTQKVETYRLKQQLQQTDTIGARQALKARLLLTNVRRRLNPANE